MAGMFEAVLIGTGFTNDLKLALVLLREDGYQLFVP
jgi:hypothetical protein